jgi:hypothetical protein
MLLVLSSVFWSFIACSGADTSTDTSDTSGSIDSGAGDSEDSAETRDTSNPEETGDTGGEVIPPRPLALGIPAYVYPTESAFTEWATAAGNSGGVVIINPNSGAGDARDAYYYAATSAAQVAGATVLGYVATGYGTREAEDVYRDVGRYFSWYEVDGIFFDEVPGDGPDCAVQLELYDTFAQLADQERDKVDGQKAYIALNPGTDACEAYTSIASSIVIAEDSGALLSDWEAQDWVANYPPEQFWLLAHSTYESELSLLLTTARENNVGLVYVTDDALPNPWDALPTYFERLVAEANP